MSRETVRIALTLAALNDLEVKVADIQNAYHCSLCREDLDYVQPKNRFIRKAASSKTLSKIKTNICPG